MLRDNGNSFSKNEANVTERVAHQLHNRLSVWRSRPSVGRAPKTSETCERLRRSRTGKRDLELVSLQRRTKTSKYAGREGGLNSEATSS